MPFEVNAYDGPGYVEGAPPTMRRKTAEQAIRETHREVMAAHEFIGIIALNANDFQRTMHLPVGRGRLACDEVGEFNKRARRPTYNPQAFPAYPRMVHSTTIEGEHFTVNNKEEHEKALASRLWSDTPIEVKRRVPRTEAQRYEDLDARLRDVLVYNRDLERKLNEGVALAPAPDPNHALIEELTKERERNKTLSDKMEEMFAKLELMENKLLSQQETSRKR